MEVVIEHVEQKPTHLLKLGWIMTPSGWTPARGNDMHDELLIACLYTAACHFHLAGCVAICLGAGQAVMEGARVRLELPLVFESWRTRIALCSSG